MATDDEVSDVVGHVLAVGGVISRARLVAATSRAAAEAALRHGAIVVDGRGCYATPATELALRRAHALAGVLSLTSAALHHGWEVKTVPVRPHVTVPRKRRVSVERRSEVELHWADLHDDDIVNGIATSVEATLRQCMSQLPWDEALVIADSALRHGVPPSVLRRLARSARGPGSRQLRRVAAEASGESANPFESVLRAIALDVPGLHVRPQLGVRTATTRVRPDLVDDDLRVILEADSFEWHGGRAALAADARRYNLLVVEGWLVLRFAWEDVMFDPDYVRTVLVAVVAFVDGQAQRGSCRCGAA